MRTFEQDPKYPIRLLVDIAIKALSPAINDPTTAVQTIDQLEDLLHRLGSADLDAGYVSDKNGALRLVFPTPTWEDYLTLSFDEIRQFGSSSIQVTRRMRSALSSVSWNPCRVQDGPTWCGDTSNTSTIRSRRRHLTLKTGVWRFRKIVRA